MILKAVIVLGLTEVFGTSIAAVLSKSSAKLPVHESIINHTITSFDVNRHKAITVLTKDGIHFKARNAITNPDHLWPDGQVPVVFDQNIPAFSKIEILAAMEEIELSTYSNGNPCITFVPHSTETDYVHISWTSGLQGSTSIGRAGGRQDMTINSAGGRGHDDNLYVLLLTLGLLPEVMRRDRDSYLNINFNNAISRDPFNVLTGQGTSSFGQDFDFGSLLLINPYIYARDPSLPVTTAKLSGKVMGQGVSLTMGDAKLLQHTYHCPVDTSNVINLLGSLLIECHFHTDWCTFTQDTTDNFDWTIQSGHSATLGTGPNADYSSGSGSYLVATAVNHHNQVAGILSPQIAPGEYCLRINLYMFGQDVGTLKISALHSGGSVDFMNQSGQLGNNWYHIYLTINSLTTFQIQVQATIGNGDQGDIAIDDVYMYNGQCIEW